MGPLLIRQRAASLVFASLSLALLLPSCIRARAERGLEPTWADADPATFVRGETTRADVLERLGVPSQVLTVGDGTALYYLQERTANDGYILLVYNSRVEEVRYDRAIFFFDENDRLTEYSTRAGVDVED